MNPTPRRSLDSLAQLGRQSRERSFTLDDLDWSLPADPAKPWLPDGICALAYLPAWRLLDERERLRANQLHALGIAEQFIWVEQRVMEALVAALGGRCEMPHALRQALWRFVEEEDKHVAMFRRLLERSEPQWYPSPGPRMFGLSALQEGLMARVVAHPDLLLAWIWMTIFTEERTLFLSREYLRARRRTPGRVDALHTQVHAFHLRDEARHVQLDQHLLAAAYDAQPAWKRALCGWMFARIVRAYVFPHRTAGRVLDVMARTFPRLARSIVPQLRAELPAIGYDLHFHRSLFGRDALPRTLALLEAYPEHQRARDLFLGAPRHPQEETRHEQA